MTRIDEIGEDALIAMFAPLLPDTDAEILGPGDDAAVLSVDGDLVVSSDMLVEGHHFRNEWSSAADVGWRAAMQNLADIDAMGAVPTALQVSLAAPGHTDVEWVLGFARGLAAACAPHGVGVVGGDLSASDRIVVAVTALGETHGTDPVTRADAGDGDVLAVSAPLGAARAGYELLQDPDLDDVSEHPAVEAFLRPSPRIGAGLEAALHGATAMMDVSDGLIRDVGRIARASEAGIAIDSSLVPIAEECELGAAGRDAGTALEWALTGGEDHVMLAAFPRGRALPEGWTVIGEVTDAFRGVRVDGTVHESQGWDHFGQ